MLYYLTEPDGSATKLKAVMRSIYEADLGKPLPKDTDPPQHDGRIQYHTTFDTWTLKEGVPDPDNIGQWLTPPTIKPGAHGAVFIYPREDNPTGTFGPESLAALATAGIEVLRADEIGVDEFALLPKFQ